MPCLWAGSRLVEENPLFQSVDNVARKYGLAAQNPHVCRRYGFNVVCRRTVFQNIPLSSGVRFLCKSRFLQVWDKIVRP